VSGRLLLLIGIIAIAGIGIFIYLNLTAPVSSESFGEPINISNDPIQTSDTLTMLSPMQIGSARFFFTIKAKYKLSGVLVSTHNYRTGFMSSLSPYDFATCWGNTPELFPYLRFSQYSRYCHFKYKLSSPVNKDYVLSHMSNNHMIPSTVNLRRALKAARKLELVEIEGYLVNVMANNKGRGTTNWNTSTRRDDTGNGACEIIYVTRLRLNNKIYE
jgi:hypothetical protein